MSTVIGIAFGNTTSSIAVEKDGKVEVIANQDGDRAIPSTLSYVNTDEYHGAQAKAQLVRHANNTITNFRDFIGKPFENIDVSNCHASAHPFNNDGEVAFKITANSEEILSVEEVVKRHLIKLIDSASDYIGKPIDGAVIAVPTDFTEAERKALVSIAEKANLKVLQVINEPTAALLAHASAGNHLPQDKITVVADFGGSRSDGAVIASRGGMFTVLATSHDYTLGGSNLDEVLIDFFAKEFQKKFNTDAKSEPRSLAKLRAECEQTKKTLSNSTSSTIAIESMAGGYDFHSTINRLRFEVASRSVFEKFTSFVEALVKKTGFDFLDIDEILLVGGTSQTPKIANALVNLFPESTKVVAPVTDTKAINPNELIARGCALQASLISSFEQEQIDESIEPVVTVAPHLTKSIGVQITNGTDKSDILTILEHDTALPIRKSKIVVAPQAGDALVAIFEGEPEIVVTRIEAPKKDESAPADDEESDWSEEEEDDEEIREKIVKAGKKLAEIGLEGVAPGAKIEVILNITKDLKLQVSAREIGGNGVAVRGVVA
ncbi:putative Hsp70 chaperone [Nadsonia fulvescens var. elongata DSM 6958]|uniref:Putative Hsp70 chaperone n=1 Tax=Nadsonia fulvescens var. elongata DSM 6958 TaxID=857566 RepID=A0A1E3PLU8_9ASCO|nr:putative Hsp70 chaperone [Nadsonia fulvescens var. elongata DSM 6958]